MMNHCQPRLPGRLLDQLERSIAPLTDEEIRYYQGCGFDDTCSMPTSPVAARPTRTRGRPGNNIRRFFYAIGTSPEAAEKLCRQYDVSLNTVRQALRFDRYPERGRVRTQTIHGTLMIWRQR